MPDNANKSVLIEGETWWVHNDFSEGDILLQANGSLKIAFRFDKRLLADAR